MKWTTNNIIFRKNWAEFFKNIKNIRDTLKKKFESRHQSRFSFSFKIFTSSSVRQKNTILEKNNSKEFRTSSSKTKRNKSSSWNEITRDSLKINQQSRELEFRSLRLSSNKSIEYRKFTVKSKQSSSSSNSQRDSMTASLDSTMLQVIKTAVETVFATHASATRSLESSEFTDSSKSQEDVENSLIDSEMIKWNSKDVEYFDSNYESKSSDTEELVVHSEKNTYYRDVHIFVKWIKKMTVILESNVVRNNLSTCLRKTTLI